METEGHHGKDDGKQYKYKVIWEEEENKKMMALGDDFKIEGSYLRFFGRHGEIVFSPRVWFIIK